MSKHVPVMTSEVLEWIQVEDGGLYLDATFGSGGHSKAILDSGGRVFAIDRDRGTLPILRSFQSDYANRFDFSLDCFSNMGMCLGKSRFDGATLDGAIMDLGVSTFQLEDRTRGFSFMEDGDLDMRMGVGSEMTASEVLNSFSQKKLESILREYGEEPKAASIAKLIVSTREKEKFHSSRQLAQVCSRVWSSFRKRHPATLTFQALRIFVNRELEELEQALIQLERLLKEGGRVVVISFHSLEDRLVKAFFKKSRAFHAFKKVVLPDASEVTQNVRARSAKLRCAWRV